MAIRVETTEYDPRYTSAQSLADAKARYLHQEGYTLTEFERDVDRLIDS